MSEAVVIAPPLLNKEIESLKTQIGGQLDTLGVYRSSYFSLSQDSQSNILVSGDDDKANKLISQQINQSDHF